MTLLDVIQVFRDALWVDLTHSFDSSIPHSESFEPERRTVLYHYDKGIGTKGQGFLAHEYCHVGQWGTHVDPPAHFMRGLRFLDEIPITDMIAPLVIIDIDRRVSIDPDATALLSDVAKWENAYGEIPAGAFVALRTGWDKRWPDQTLMQNKDSHGTAHFPGWSAEVLEFLVEQRNVVAIGHDTTDTDPGIVIAQRRAPLEEYWLSQNKWQIELLANLADVPVHGSIIVAAWPKPRQGSGFPARCFAICAKTDRLGAM